MSVWIYERSLQSIVELAQPDSYTTWSGTVFPKARAEKCLSEIVKSNAVGVVYDTCGPKAKNVIDLLRSLDHVVDTTDRKTLLTKSAGIKSTMARLL